MPTLLLAAAEVSTFMNMYLSLSSARPMECTYFLGHTHIFLNSIYISDGSHLWGFLFVFICHVLASHCVCHISMMDPSTSQRQSFCPHLSFFTHMWVCLLWSQMYVSVSWTRNPPTFIAPMDSFPPAKPGLLQMTHSQQQLRPSARSQLIKSLHTNHQFCFASCILTHWTSFSYDAENMPFNLNPVKCIDNVGTSLMNPEPQLN